MAVLGGLSMARLPAAPAVAATVPQRSPFVAYRTLPPELPRTLAGRLEALGEMFESGFIDRATYARLLETPTP